MMKNVAMMTALKMARWTQAQCAEAAGVSQAAVSALVQGKGNPRAETLTRVARAFGLVADDLLPTVAESETVAESAGVPVVLDAVARVWKAQVWRPETDEWVDMDGCEILADAVGMADAESADGCSARVVCRVHGLELRFLAEDVTQSSHFSRDNELRSVKEA